MSLFSLALAAPNLTKQLAWVRWAKRAISAGRQRKVAVTAVSWYYSVHSSTKLINNTHSQAAVVVVIPLLKTNRSPRANQSPPSARYFRLPMRGPSDRWTQSTSSLKALRNARNSLLGGLLRSDSMVWFSPSLLIPPQGQPGSLRGPPRKTPRRGWGSCLSSLGKNSRQSRRLARKLRTRSINVNI